jgi:phytoene synthase
MGGLFPAHRRPDFAAAAGCGSATSGNPRPRNGGNRCAGARTWEETGYLLLVVRPVMSLQACADLVARGDPDRFRATMATPPKARAVLFPDLCLQPRGQPRALGDGGADDRRDAPAVLARRAGGGPRGRPGAAPRGGQPLGRDPRCSRCYPARCAGRGAALGYLPRPVRGHDPIPCAYRGNLGRPPAHGGAASGRPGARGPLLQAGFAQGVANWLLAVPRLEAAGRIPLVEGTQEAVRALALEALAALDTARAQQCPNRRGPLVSHSGKPAPS